jgi:hypothetical protein
MADEKPQAAPLDYEFESKTTLTGPFAYMLKQNGLWPGDFDKFQLIVPPGANAVIVTFSLGGLLLDSMVIKSPAFLEEVCEALAIPFNCTVKRFNVTAELRDGDQIVHVETTRRVSMKQCRNLTALLAPWWRGKNREEAAREPVETSLDAAI